MAEDDKNPGSVALGSEDGACVSNGECCDLADLESVELRKEEHGSRQAETCSQRVDKKWKLMLILSLNMWWIWDWWFEVP